MGAKLKGSFSDTLEEYADEVRRELRYTIEAQARKLRDEARRIVPVDTGQLQKSIAVSQSIRERLHFFVGTNVEYAKVVEFGFTGTQEVSAHKRTQEKVYGQEVDPFVVSVDEHTRRVDREGHFYLTKAARRQKKPFDNALKEAVKRAAP